MEELEKEVAAEKEKESRQSLHDKPPNVAPWSASCVPGLHVANRPVRGVAP